MTASSTHSASSAHLLAKTARRNPYDFDHLTCISTNPFTQVPEDTSNMDTNTSPEPPPSLQDFPQFPSFPLEIRLHIWHATFPPPRRVYFDTTASCRDLKRAKALPGNAPISLSINQESRKETQRHYAILENEYMPRCSKGPVAVAARKSTTTTFFYPERDTLVLCAVELIPVPDLFIAAIAHIGERLEGGVEAIRHVEFMYVGWRTAPKFSWGFRLWKAVRSLPGLHTLRLATYDDIDPKNRERALAELEKQKGSFSSGVPPKLSFVRWEYG